MSLHTRINRGAITVIQDCQMGSESLFWAPSSETEPLLPKKS